MTTRITLALCAFVLGGCNSNSDELCASLHELAQPIAPMLMSERLPTDWAPSEIAFIAEFAEQGDLILLGEEQHGVLEFTRLKARLVAELVAHAGVRLVFLEQGVADVMEIDRWIGGAGSVDELPSGGLYWCWAVESFGDLLKWLRSYNVGRTPDDRVHIIGVDVQSPGAALREIMSGIAAVEGSIDEQIRAEIEILTRDPYSYPNVGQPVQDDVREAIEQVVARVEAVVSGSGDDLLRATSNLVTSEEYFRIVDQRTQMSRRDELMAAEIIETMSAHGAPSAVVWGHNAHIKTAEDPSDRFVSMGYVLKRSYDGDLLSVGLFLGQGQYLRDPRLRRDGETQGRLAPSENSWNARLAACFREPVLVDLRAAPVALDRELRKELPTSWSATSLTGSHDGIIFVPSVTSAVPW